MWIVRLALRRPYTFVVAAVSLLIFGAVAILRTPVDIFPNLDMPVVSVLYTYNGLSPEDMSARIVFVYERGLTAAVNNIAHIDSQSLNGRAIIRIFLQPGVDVASSVGQIVSWSVYALHSMPPGTQPPLVIQYNASTVPIIQLGLSGEGLSEQQVGDLTQNFIRVGLMNIRGAAAPTAYGGKQRQIQADLNTQDLQAHGLSPVDIVNAIGAQSLIIPAGTAKIGPFEYQVDMTSGRNRSRI
jgi:multidrug efflux pump subunit AcrB